MENNLDFWDKLSTPPKQALSKIKAGRIKGMTDIKPIWRIKAMTELFGPCGIGWKYEVVKRWTEPVSDGQIIAFVDVAVYIYQKPATSSPNSLAMLPWSEPIPGNGGSMLIAKESRGLYSSTEAFKMATTDALSSAFKMIGVAADVYFGGHDESKYSQPTGPKAKALMTKKQSDELIKYCTDEKLEPVEIAQKYGITKQMTSEKFDLVFLQFKKDVEAGEIGFRFAIPEGKKEDLSQNTEPVKKDDGKNTD